MDIADRVSDVPPSGIRRFFELAEEMDDVISLGVGEPDFSAPWSARKAAIDSLEMGRTSYTANRGRRELRELIAEHVADRYDLSYDPEDAVLVTTGVSEALDLALRATVDPGDTVAVPDPSYVSYRPGVTFAGAEHCRVPTGPDDDFRVTVDALRDAGADDADVLVLNYPNNPTGAVMRREHLEPVAAFCQDEDVAVISDEVYAELTYGDDHVSIAALDGMRERTVRLDGFSKAYAMTGMRLGYATGPADVVGAMNRIHQYTMLSAPTTAQYMAVDALEHCQDDVAQMRKQFDRRRNVVLNRLDGMGLDCFTAEGAFYAFPECPGGDDEAFAEELLTEQNVAVVPGSVFGESGAGHLRMSYATGMEELKEALRRIAAVVE